MSTLKREKVKYFSSEHTDHAAKHFLKRLHERFGCGGMLSLHSVIVQAIMDEDRSRVRYIRDQPAKIPSSQHSRRLRQEYLANICDRYVVLIYCPAARTIYTCWWVTQSIPAYQLKNQVVAEGGLTSFEANISKRPSTRVRLPVRAGHQCLR